MVVRYGWTREVYTYYQLAFADRLYVECISGVEHNISRFVPEGWLDLSSISRVHIMEGESHLLKANL